MTAPAPHLTARREAQQRLGRIRDALAVADELLAAAYAARDWAALGHPSWAAYCAHELPELRLLALRPEPRNQRVRSLSDAGLSIGAIADALGVGKATAHRALQGHQRPATVTSTDGRVRKARSASSPRERAAAPVPYVEQLVELLRARGPLTCTEVERLTRHHHGSASAALHRLAAAGRITYTAPARRGLVGTYSTGEGQR